MRAMTKRWCFSPHLRSEIEKVSLDYLITLWWRDLHEAKAGLSMGFTLGLIYGLSVEARNRAQSALYQELKFLYEVANEITKETLK